MKQLDRQYLIAPQSVVDSYSPAYFRDRKRAIADIYPQEIPDARGTNRLAIAVGRDGAHEVLQVRRSRPVVTRPCFGLCWPRRRRLQGQHPCSIASTPFSLRRPNSRLVRYEAPRDAGSLPARAEPIAECTADLKYYGFRPKRSAADAMVRYQLIFVGADRAMDTGGVLRRLAFSLTSSGRSRRRRAEEKMFVTIC
jgi:hypothetical protein